MTAKPLFFTTLALLALLAPSALAEDAPATPASRLADTHADAVVSIKFVLKLQMTMMGQSQEEEMSREVRGVLIGSDGLVLTSSTHFDGGLPPGLMAMLGGDMDIQGTPTDIKVLFGTEEKEYDASMVAKDSDLGLAFLKIDDLGDMTPKFIDLDAGASAAIGHELLGLTRMSRAFDCAPMVDALRVIANVDTPRTMWAVSGDFAAVGMPVFLADGRPVGVLVTQGGAEEAAVDLESGAGLMGLIGGADDIARPFVLPLDTVKSVVARARAQAEEAAKKAAEEAGSEEEDGSLESDG